MEPIIISASFFQEQLSLGVLGRTGEHEARRISFDCGEVLKTWPEATILCVCRRPCDTAAYPIPLTTDGTTYTMPLTSRETAASGTIKLELRAVQDDIVLKSAIFYGRILPSLNGQKDAPGNPLSDALNRLESTIANAQTLADEIRQKLDNGEFVGERGPQGEPGKDGSDATVTAQNIESALGYSPADKVVVDQLSEEKADKKDIPAPYTLPTASADVKGGVKVGEGLQMYGEVLEVKQEEYELIETITLEEELTNIERTKEPDGTELKLKSLMILSKIPPVATTDGYQQQYTSIGKSYPLVGCGSSFVSKMNEFATRHIYQQKNGIWDVTGQYGTSSSNANTVGQVSAQKIITINELPEINCIKIYTFGKGFPAGMVIYLWGVRADA